MVTNRRATGDAGGALAADWYRARRYAALDRKWRRRQGELGLVLGGPGVVVFCEVKTRQSATFGEPYEAVTVAKQRRIRGLALRWLGEHPSARTAQLRFDVVSVRVDAVGDAAITVVEAAF